MIQYPIMSTVHDFWIKEDNWVPVKTNHFQTITELPDQFGMTAGEIEEICSQFSETSVSDGPAHDAIIRRATENGWIRIRCFNETETRVVVQGSRIDTRIPSVSDLISEIRKRRIIGEAGTVVLSDYATGETRSFRIGDSGITEEVEGDLDLS